MIKVETSASVMGTRSRLTAWTHGAAGDGEGLSWPERGRQARYGIVTVI